MAAVLGAAQSTVKSDSKVTATLQVAPFTSPRQTSYLSPRLRSSAVALLQDGQPASVALLIDRRGLYVAAGGNKWAGTLQARDANGNTVLLTVRAVDQLTGLTLFARTSGIGNLSDPIRLAGQVRTGVLTGLAVNDAARVELVSTDRMGILGPKRRLVPLAEVRFEGDIAGLTDAFFFQQDELVGTLVTTLESAVGGTADSQDRITLFNNLQRKGPGDLTVAYITTPALLRRVFEGFRSPSGQILYPYLGLFCRDAVNGGAEVVSVAEDGNARRAGLRPGDVIRTIGGVPVGNQIDFARILFNQRIGSRISITFVRQATMYRTFAIVGQSVD